MGCFPHALQTAFMTSLLESLAHFVPEPEAKKLKITAEKESKGE